MVAYCLSNTHYLPQGKYLVLTFSQHKGSFKTSKRAARKLPYKFKEEYYGSTTQRHSNERKQTAWYHNRYSGKVK
jgi:hypothetical protein